MPRTITIPSGATLSGLAKQYKTSINELMSLNPTIKDPNKIFAGATLNIPELAGTLETGGEKEKVLPTQPVDKLSVFGDVLKMVTQRAAQEAITAGREALPEGMLEPEKISGGTFASVLDLVSRQKTRGISDIYESTVKMIEDSRTRAKDQLQMLVNTGAISKLDDGTLEKLSAMTDFDFEYLKSIRTLKQEEIVSKWQEEPGKRDFTDIAQTLYNVGIPSTVATNTGELQKSMKSKLIEAGISAENIDILWDAILEGFSFDEIREDLLSQIGDRDTAYGLLDIFVQTLQEKKAGETPEMSDEEFMKALRGE